MTENRQPKGVPIGGQFAANSHDEAGASLSPVEYESPAVTAHIIYEKWDGDYANEVDRETVNLSSVLDAYDLEDLPEDGSDDYGYTDMFFSDAENMNLREKPHDGPYTVSIDEEDYQAYLEARRTSGRDEAFSRIPHHSAKEREKIVTRALGDALGRLGLSATVLWWKTDDDARAWANNAGEVIEERLSERGVDRDLMEQEDTTLIEEINSLRGGIGTTEGYLDRAKHIATALGDRIISKYRDAEDAR